MGAGMRLAGAPATESITGSLPPERANIGSAVNDAAPSILVALVAAVGAFIAWRHLPARGVAGPAAGPARIAIAKPDR
jgi:hypothetical protein